MSPTSPASSISSRQDARNAAPTGQSPQPPTVGPPVRPEALCMRATLLLLAAAAPPLAQPQGTVQAMSCLNPLTGRQTLFNIYLPPGYSGSAERYPAIYHLHGITGNQGGQQNTTVPASFEAASGQGLIGPVIVVFPNGYSDSWWADSIAG